MSLLITGGLGYIGSHIAKIARNKKIIVLDNLSNSKLNYKKILPHVKVFIKDLNYKNLDDIFKKFKIKEVIHLAGHKSVNESISEPINYYKNNVVTTIELLESMDKLKINKLIFSSSATVYGNNQASPLKETFSTSAINPYGETKIINEKIIMDHCKASDNFSSIILRYFNPVGAHPSGLLSDNPLGEPQNLMPLIVKAAKGKKLNIFGKDYPTKDGTCIRDYIHILDLAKGHLLALKLLNKYKGCEIINVGKGRGISVLELVKIFEKTNDLKINFDFAAKREGDAAISYSCNKKLKKIFGWTPKHSYEQMCKDAWNASN